MVASFAGRLDLSLSQYTFSVVTLGGFGGQSALRQLVGILKRRSGRGLMPFSWSGCRGITFSCTNPRQERNASGSLLLPTNTWRRLCRPYKILQKPDRDIPPGPAGACPVVPRFSPASTITTGNFPQITPALRAGPVPPSARQKISNWLVADRSGNTTATLLRLCPPLPGRGDPGREKDGRTGTLLQPGSERCGLQSAERILISSHRGKLIQEGQFREPASAINPPCYKN